MLYVFLRKLLINGNMMNIALRVFVEVPQDILVHRHGPRSMYLKVVHEAISVDCAWPAWLEAVRRYEREVLSKR
jgi:hypothetical protein